MKNLIKNPIFLFFLGAVFDVSLGYGDQICTNILDEEGTIIAQSCQDSKRVFLPNHSLEKNENTTAE